MWIGVTLSCGCSTNITRPLCSGALASLCISSSLAPPRTSSHLQTVGGGGPNREVRPGERANVPMGFLRGPPRLHASSAAPEKTLQGCSSSAGGAGTPPQPRLPSAKTLLVLISGSNAEILHTHVMFSSFLSLFFCLILSCCAAVSAAEASRGNLRLGSSVPTAEKWFLRSRTLAVAAPLRSCRCSRAFPPRSCRAYR